MAQKVAVHLVDDLDGSEAESTTEFGLDGVSSAIDLSALTTADGLDAWIKVESPPSVKLGEKMSIPRPTSAPGTLRLRIREVELLAPIGQPPSQQTGTPGELTERVVFTDLVPLP